MEEIEREREWKTKERKDTQGCGIVVQPRFKSVNANSNVNNRNCWSGKRCTDKLPAKRNFLCLLKV